MNQKINKKQIKELIYDGKFQEAKKLLKIISLKNLETFLLELAFENYNITIYGFICSLLLEEETAEMHSIAAVILSSALCHYEGAYSLGLFHARKAVELDAENIEYKEHLLLFHDIPEHLVDSEEGIKIAKQILSKNPHSITAHSLLKKYRL